MIQSFISALESKGFEIPHFLGLIDGTAQDVFRHDIFNCVAKSDLMVAVCDLPSTGLGFEMCHALHVCNIPLLAVGHEKSRVTRLVLGIDHPLFTFQRYNSSDDLLMLTLEKISTHKKEALAA